MDTDMGKNGPPPNWLAPTSGGVILLFVGVLLLALDSAGGAAAAFCLLGVLLAGYGLAKRDRVKRYGR